MLLRLTVGHSERDRIGPDAGPTSTLVSPSPQIRTDCRVREGPPTREWPEGTEREAPAPAAARAASAVLNAGESSWLPSPTAPDCRTFRTGGAPGCACTPDDCSSPGRRGGPKGRGGTGARAERARPAPDESMRVPEEARARGPVQATGGRPRRSPGWPARSSWASLACPGRGGAAPP